MSHFDTPHTGYGSHPNPVMYFTEVSTFDEMDSLKKESELLGINYERWFVGADTDLHESLNTGIIVYYPQYNCLRNGDHMEPKEVLPIHFFTTLLRKHPKHLGSMFIKSKTTNERDELIAYFESKNYRLHDIVKFDIELALFVNEPTKTLVVHSNLRADENEREGNYPVMNYEDFKIYMQ